MAVRRIKPILAEIVEALDGIAADILRHEYHKTSGGIVWAVVTDSLQPLRLAVERMLEASRRQ
ncbi:hypothetical protein [Mesorhizobium sp. M7A.F.Ca.US.008.03.1.1]|uniref:hypothetical protein n=1 Tax=Mesorhizobium sp. M7A.F.Ca.US.008.03.1.1 TaxID=2496742 RepID=UPI000FCA8CC2|nr:hypothetical protein [Mesorhizobium sp. M7A.F.Ca.US.008.03.1.1]RUW61645.1 hypothetical protein EOA16_11845 [Mesorhizobium sp. M7A.F.Ca.US.008.03.1.1]